MARGRRPAAKGSAHSPLRVMPALLVPMVVGAYLWSQDAVGYAEGLLLAAAAVAGPAIAALSPSCLHATLLAAITAGLLVGAIGTVRLHTLAARERHASQGAHGAATVAWFAPAPRRPPQPLVPLETLSIVLPCAYEGANAVRTVDSIWQHTNHSRIKEFILVDDGSNPPLETELPTDLLNGHRVGVPVTVLRQPKTMGLIAAKKRGGDACKGDVIVFLDCHVAPNDGWEEAFLRQMKRAGDHRTVVVPMISTLDVDKWVEVPTGPKSYACYTLWNADFTWLGNAGRDVPLMSGGLLALSRRWWEETGGLDDQMIAWGGENIDQSIRTWVCGGRIELAENASIAHMWRDSKNPKTERKFPMPSEDVMRNKARAVAAWFDEFKEKAFAFPEFEDIVAGRNPIGNMSHFAKVKSELGCKPFSWYIQRFDYVYIHSGLIPEEVFQLREEHTGLCLERTQSAELHHGGAILAPCADPKESDLQLWHLGNRDRSRKGGPCCSGFMNWNFMLCLNSAGVGATVNTFECDISGYSDTQKFRLAPDGQVEFLQGKGCLAPAMPSVAQASHSPVGTCKVKVVSAGPSYDGAFRLMTSGEQLPRGLESACAAAVPTKGGDPSVPGSSLGFQKCEGPQEAEHLFHPKAMLEGFQVRVGESDLCLDAAGGSNLLAYPCYDASVGNRNQVFHVEQGELVWRGTGANDYCVDVDVGAARAALEAGASAGGIKLETCVSKEGQRLAKDDYRDGTFHIRDKDSAMCLVRKDGSAGGDKLGMGECSEDQRWRELVDQVQVQHVSSTYCLDAGDELAPILYPCHTPKAQRKQKFRMRADGAFSSIRMDKGWEDNGRRIFFERCLDYKADPPVDLAVRQCPAVRNRGVRFSKVGARVPPEALIWQRMVKPGPGDPPLGGDAQPP